MDVLSTSAFSSNGGEVIEKKLDTVFNDKSEEIDVVAYFEIERSIDFICSNGYQRVALQFPDELLPWAFQVASLLRKGSKQYIFVLGDTSYGSCCIDEIAAQHLNADCMIHYGRSCLSRTSRLPVLYVFGKKKMNTSDCISKLDALLDLNSLFILFYDLAYTHIIGELYNEMITKYTDLYLTKLCLPKEGGQMLQGSIEKTCHQSAGSKCCNCESTSPSMELLKIDDYQHCHPLEYNEGVVHCRFGRYVVLPKDKKFEDFKLIYIGGEGLTLRNLMMSYNRQQFYSYNPESKAARMETLSVNRALMKRYFFIQKAKEAKVVGILVGTLGVANYISIMARLKKMLKQVGKKYYTFVVGKLNVPKLANFMEIDVYVLIACAENSLIDSQEFYRPIVTPFEMEVACLRAREWTGDYITDFKDLLPGSATHIDLKDEIPSDEPEYSLITGNLLGTSGESQGEATSQSLVERNKEDKLAVFDENSGAKFLMARSWHGLQKGIDDTPVEKAQEGRSGIAAGYTHEPEVDK